MEKQIIDIFEISPQAQMVIIQSKHSMEEFIKWIKGKHHKINIGGNHATLFLEEMFKQEARK